MIATLKCLLQLFAVTCCLFGGIIGLSVGIVMLGGEGIGSALSWGAFMALVAGVPSAVLMTLICGGMHVYSVWRLGYRLTDETLSVRQRRRLTVELPFAEAFTLWLASVRYLGRADVEEETDFATGVILAKKRSGFGEHVRFDLRQVAGGTDVVIACRPHLRTTLVDDGSSLQIMDALVGFLLAHGEGAEGEFAAEKSEHLRGSSGHVEGRPASVRQSEEGPSLP